MNVSVVVPFNSKDKSRKAIWKYIKAKWRSTYPEWPVVMGYSSDPEWCKGQAVSDALSKVETELVIVIDADVWIPKIDTTLRYFKNSKGFVKPHRRFVRLTEAATRRVLDGEPLEVVGEERTSWERKPYAQVLGGACLVLRTEDARKVHIDHRFKGWGGEDISWGKALTVVLGGPSREPLTAYHLWHKPAPRLHHELNSQLANRYRTVQNKGGILALLNEPGAMTLDKSV